uniref:ARAD1C01078p n=1 Tax=Blastobotrys adeninivorans TaxID=409370 RepID=A0A060SYG8_BLAAD
MSLRRSDSKVPFWDSSDPGRNPPPMPLHPDSPNLNSTPTSNMRSGTGSPIKSSFHSRTLSSFAASTDDSRITELLELSRDLKSQTNTVESSVRDALYEFGGLADRSRDNAVALAELRDQVYSTKTTVTSTDTSIKDNLVKLQSSLEGQKESQRALTTVTDALLDSTKSIQKQIQTYDAQVRELVRTSDDMTLTQAVSQITTHFDKHNQSLIHILESIKHGLHSTPSHSDDFKTLITKVDTLSNSLPKSDNNKELQSIASKIDDLARRDGEIKSLSAKVDSMADRKGLESISRNLDGLAQGLPKHDDIQTILSMLKSSSADNFGPILETMNTLSGSFAKSDEHHQKLVSELSTKLDDLSQSLSKGQPADKDVKDILSKLDELSQSAPNKDIQRILSKLDSDQDTKSILSKLDELSQAAPNKEIQKILSKLDSNEDIKGVSSKLDELSKAMPNKDIQLLLSKLDSNEHIKGLSSKLDELTQSLPNKDIQLLHSKLDSNTDTKSILSKLDELSQSLPNKDIELMLSKLDSNETKEDVRSILSKLDEMSKAESSETKEDIRSISSKLDDLSKALPNKDIQSILSKLDSTDHKEDIKSILAHVKDSSHHDTLREISSSVSKLHSSRETIETSLNQITELVKGLSSSTDSELSDKIISHVEKLQESSVTQVDKLANQLGDLTKSSQQLPELNETLGQMQKELDRRQAQNETQLQTVLDSIKSLSFADALAKLEIMEKNGSSMDQALSTLQDKLNTVDQGQKDVSQSVEKLLQQFTENLQDSGVRDEMNKGFDRLFEQLSALGQNEEHSRALGGISSQLDALKQAANAEPVSSEAEKQILDKLQHLEGVVGELKSHGDHVKQLVDLHKGLEQSVEKSSSHGQDLARSVEEVSSKLNDHKERHNQVHTLLTEVSKIVSAGRDEETKAITSLQADVQSIIDFQYGDIAKLSDQIRDVASRLESVSEIEKRAQEAEQRAQQAEEKLKATTEGKLLSRLDERLAQFDKEIEQKSHQKRELDESISKMQTDKDALSKDLESLRAELRVRYQEFSKLEERVDSFESRLSNSLLERSKGILGSATMTIISNNTTGRKPLTDADDSSLNGSMRSRNQSMGPDELHPLGKENDGDLNIGKRRATQLAKQNRSVSLFVDPTTTK